MSWVLAGKIIWVFFAVGWCALRYVPNRRARRTPVSRTVRTPLEWTAIAVSTTGIGIIPALWVVTGFPKQLDFQPFPIAIVAGGLVAVFALYLFRLTHKALGRMWSYSLDLREDHQLVTEGIYERVRHPMYSAFWLWGVTQALLLANWLAAFSALVGFGTLYFLRVGQEEAMMRAQFGAEYDAYCARTKRIVPGIL